MATKYPNPVENSPLDIISKIGNGSFGSVYKALIRNRGVIVAVKRIRYIDDVTKEKIESAVSMGQVELNAIKALQGQPNIVNLLSYFDFDASFWICMEFCDQGNMQQYVQQRHDMSLYEVLSFTYQLSHAVEAMHTNKPLIVHRDIKPQNILIKSEAKKMVVKLCDFGVSKIAKDVSVMQTKEQGTKFFMAPEIFKEQTEGLSYDKSVDIFSLGLVYKAMLENDFCPVTVDSKRDRLSIPIGEDLLRCHIHGKGFPDVVSVLRDDDAVTQDLKRLIQHMTRYRAGDRPHIQEIERSLSGILERTVQSSLDRLAAERNEILELLDMVTEKKMAASKENTSIGVHCPPEKVPIVHCDEQAKLTDPELDSLSIKDDRKTSQTCRQYTDRQLADHAANSQATIYYRQGERPRCDYVDEVDQDALSMNPDVPEDEGAALGGDDADKGRESGYEIIEEELEESEEEEIDPDETEEDIVNKMAEAIQGTNLKQMKELVKRGISVRGKYNYKPIISYAIKAEGPQYVECIEFILHQPDMEPGDNSDLIYGLCQAAFYCKKEIMQLYWDLGYSADERDQHGYTPLHFVAKNGNVQLVKHLMDERKCLKCPKSSEGVTPLHTAAVKGNLEVVIYLIEEYSELYPVDQHQNDGKTALILAACGGSVPVTKYLISKKANLHSAENQGWTALHWAACYNYPDVIEVLVGSGADINLQSSKEETPIMIAAVNDRHKPILKLFELGADINIPVKYGHTPLFKAVEQFSPFSTWALLDCGAELNTKDNIHNFSQLIRSLKITEKLDCKEGVRMVMDSGIRFDVPWLLTMGNTYMVQHCKSMNRLYKYVSMPRSLQQWCHIVIRQSMRKPISKHLDDLELLKEIREEMSLRKYLKNQRSCSWRWGGEAEVYKSDIETTNL